MTIRTVRSETATYVDFSSPLPGLPDLRVTLPDPDAVFEARRALDDRLVRLKESIPKLEVDDEAAADVYDQLRRIGMLLMRLVFQTVPNILGVQQFFASAMRVRDPWRPQLIECVGDLRTLLPIEFLPLFVPRGERRIGNRVQLSEACRDFAGFSCLVRRSFAMVPQQQDLALRTGVGGRLPVRFLHHDGLPGAAVELGWFTGTAHDHVDLEGPYPSGDGPSLSEQVWDPSVSLNGRADRTPDQIQHFACHCYTRAADPLAGEIELSGGGRTVLTRLDDLDIDLTDRHFSRGQRVTPMPLVVMNACGASRMAATSALSFPALFLRNDNRGFIGSDIEVPDDVAAKFSAAFYSRFILCREPLGEAVHHARTYLLARFGNPLGLGYSAYADPDLRIDPQEDS